MPLGYGWLCFIAGKATTISHVPLYMSCTNSTGENEIGLHKPSTDNMAIANHKHPTSLITSVGAYAF